MSEVHSGERAQDRASEPPLSRSALVPALVHEARSPLNALMLQLELLCTTPSSTPPIPALSWERAQRQLARLDDVLELFSLLWGAPESGRADAAQLTRAAARLAERLGHRRGLVVRVEAPDTLVVPETPARVATLLLGEVAWLLARTRLLEVVWRLGRDNALKCRMASDAHKETVTECVGLCCHMTQASVSMSACLRRIELSPATGRKLPVT